MAFPTSPMSGQIYGNKIWSQEIGAWTDNKLVRNQIDISAADGINIRSTIHTAPAGVVELFRVPNQGLTTSGIFSVSATRSNFIYVATWAWTTNHNASGYGTLSKISAGNYLLIPVYLDVSGAGDAILSCDWGGSQGYRISIIKMIGSEADFTYVNSVHTNPVGGFTRYSAS